MLSKYSSSKTLISQKLTSSFHLWKTNLMSFQKGRNGIIRYQSTFLEEHKNVLSLLMNHGEGQVTLNQINDKVAEVIISNPLKRNALSGKMIYELASILTDLMSPKYSNIIGVILRGSEDPKPAFCAGLDFNLAKEVINTHERGLAMCDMMTDLFTRFKMSQLISIAYVHGPALGGGAELTTGCDIRIMTPSSTIGFVHAKVGASPGFGGAQRLVNIVGRHNAILICCSAKVLNAETCLRMGLADVVLSDESDYITQVHDFLSQFTNIPTTASVRGMKQLIANLAEAELPSTARGMERKLFAERWGSEENLAIIGSKVKSKPQ